MSRKNLLQFDVSPRDKTSNEEAAKSFGPSSEIRNMDPASDIPANPVSRALRGIEEKAARSNEYDEKIAAGLVIYELDHQLIDFSFIKDRIDLESAAIDDLKEKISEVGQSSPILVRPHPTATGRYQIVYGHRRYLATKALGIPVKAIIKGVDDRELIIAQGQENNDHVGLSFIERAQFAFGIRALGYELDVVMQAINANQSLAYKMLSIAEKIGPELIAKIGPAPGIGRRKWEELVDKLNAANFAATDFLQQNDIQKLDSDQRFEALLRFTDEQNVISNEPRARQLSTAVESKGPETWTSPNNDLIVQMKPNAKSFELSFKKPQSHRFGVWLSNRMSQLYSEFQDSENTENKNGE
ncbi:MULTISPECIES: plasmid partitioning protein RepB [Brucella/Ochrobactrum group]|uniref:plasmid partitioning protein RepB n=1 Tax=Brucella/Ochrobactrum group TaxID=2826938 RepID=UPI000F678A56|nr:MULTISPECIES: plasmid partitioning protein RepB [Brucella/Ochrobactrum group]MCQ9147591.1 plasmid partitioning protein RepB [Ochrobactrum sp. BTU2]RRY16709.1 plasmid partitioning protein RepB [Brucella anthropi]